MNASQYQMFNCEFCGENHDNMDYYVSAFSKQVNILGNFQWGQNNYQMPIQTQFINETKIDF